jgi:hypothetical protein
MRIGRCLFVMAVGAILSFAVTRSPSWLNVHTVGAVLIVVGAIGLLLGQIRNSARRSTVIQSPTATTYIESREAAGAGRYGYDETSVGESRPGKV